MIIRSAEKFFRCCRSGIIRPDCTATFFSFQCSWPVDRQDGLVGKFEVEKDEDHDTIPLKPRLCHPCQRYCHLRSYPRQNHCSFLPHEQLASVHRSSTSSHPPTTLTIPSTPTSSWTPRHPLSTSFYSNRAGHCTVDGIWPSWYG